MKWMVAEMSSLGFHGSKRVTVVAKDGSFHTFESSRKVTDAEGDVLVHVFTGPGGWEFHLLND